MVISEVRVTLAALLAVHEAVVWALSVVVAAVLEEALEEAMELVELWCWFFLSLGWCLLVNASAPAVVALVVALAQLAFLRPSGPPSFPLAVSVSAPSVALAALEQTAQMEQTARAARVARVVAEVLVVARLTGASS